MISLIETLRWYEKFVNIGCDLYSLTLFHSSRVQQVICNQQTELDIDALVISPLLIML